MSTLKVGRVIEARGNSSTSILTVDLQLADGSPVSFVLDTPTARALAPTIHHAVVRMADLAASGPTRSGEVQAHEPQSMNWGDDPQTKTALLLFDYGLPSEAAFRLKEKQISDLAQHLAQTMEALFGQSRGRLN